MNKFTIYIDESGTLPDPKDKIVVIAAVGTESPAKIDLIFKQVKKKTEKKELSGELKYYTAGDKTKINFFQKIIKEKFKIYILTVEKQGRKIPDTYENYAALCCFLIKNIAHIQMNCQI